MASDVHTLWIGTVSNEEKQSNNWMSSVSSFITVKRLGKVFASSPFKSSCIPLSYVRIT